MDLILSILGLVVGACVCAWLATRAWRVHQAVLRWLGAAFAGLITLVLGLVAILALVGVYRFQHPPSAPDR